MSEEGTEGSKSSALSVFGGNGERVHLKVNTFVPVPVPGWQYPNLKYYSLQGEGSDLTMFEEFLFDMEEESEGDPKKTDDLDRLVALLEEIAQRVRYPLRDGYFRHEGAAHALPPPLGKIRREVQRNERLAGLYDEHIESGHLRLYCMPLSDDVVFLFTGGFKTPGVNQAQDCSVLKPHFDKANSYCREIQHAQQVGDITWNSDHSNITVHRNLIIQIK